MDDAEPCSFCDDATENPKNLQPVSAVGAASENDAEPEWRQEVGRRLAKYRARRRGAGMGETEPEAAEPPKSQAGLPFREVTAKRPQQTQRVEIPDRPERSGTRPRTLARVRPSERMEICIQPELDFSAAAGERARPQNALVAVATLGERRNAGALDALFILLTCASFFGLFIGLLRSLGAEFVVDRIDAVMCVPVLFLFYSLYFVVFTVFAGATPGMQFCGLAVVGLDGHLPDTGRLLWRGFGYLFSGGTAMLGFLWALWDEDGFTWQDRISQTYVTSSAPLAEVDAVEVRPDRRSPVRR